MAYVPDVCYTDAQFELISEKGQIKHAALTLYGYYCKCRNKQTGLAFPKVQTIVKELGIPRTNVVMLREFLEEIGWIQVFDTGVIRLLKGFYSDEQILNFRIKRLLTNTNTCLIIRHCCLKNRQICLIIRHLFKRYLNQPIKPAQLTNIIAESQSATSADTNFEIDLSKKGLSPQRGETKPKPKINPKSGVSPRSGETTPDKRSQHPAIKMVLQIAGRYPHKDQWDLLIREIGEKPDVEFFKACWEIWRSFDGKPTNYQGWLLIPNQTGKMPEIFKGQIGQKNEKTGENNWQTVGKFDDKKEIDLETELTNLLEARADGQDLKPYRKFYREEEWQWLMDNLKQNRS